MSTARATHCLPLETTWKRPECGGQGNGPGLWCCFTGNLQKPTQHGPVTNAIFEDTCGNLIGMHQV
jgi:hypothetical protein